ncbi:MAG: lytic transglycosylase domain-containing protein [Blastocatellia bacterium]
MLRLKAFNLIKVLMVLAVVVVLVFVGSITPIYAKGKAKTKRKAHQLTPEITQEIVQRARYYSLEPLLVLEIMRQESSFNPNACSKANARGLMQFIPSTAARFGITNPHDISQSIDAGCRYLVFLIRKFNGRLDLVLAGYNAGEGAVERYGNRVPPYEETQNYVKTIISNYKRALAVKEAFIAQNNLVLAQESHFNQGQGQASSINRTNYKVTPVVMKRPTKPLTKRQIQEKLAELDNISSFSNK